MALQTVLRDREIDTSLAGICGAYCGACPVYRAWAEQDLPRLQDLAGTLGTTIDRLVCTGCRTPATFCFGGDCEIKRCAKDRGVAFCPECDAYPCDRVRRFEESAAYRAAICRDARRLAEVGVTAWLREEDARWRCPGCGAPSAAGRGTCPHCGNALSER